MLVLAGKKPSPVGSWRNKKLSLLAASSVVILLFTIILVRSVNLATANPILTELPSITIYSSGLVEPSNVPISRTGNVYTLTGNISGYSLDVQCSNITLDGAGYTLQAGRLSSSSGISIEADGVIIKNVNIYGNYYYGINVSSSFDSITQNSISPYAAGIYLQGGYNNITENTLSSGHSDGIIVLKGEHNDIIGNFIHDASGGITLYKEAQFTSVVGNTISGGQTSIGLGSEHNTFYLNNFVNFSETAISLGGSSSVEYTNLFDNGFVGNYWSDYRGTDADNDGIGDKPYVIVGNLSDRYPLMAQYDIHNNTILRVPPTVHVISPENKTYNATSVDLLFSISKPAVWMGYSLDGQDNVTVTDNFTLADLSEDLHNVTVYANDTFGDMEASEIIAFTVALPEPFPTVPVAAISVAAVVVVGAILMVYFKRRKH